MSISYYKKPSHLQSAYRWEICEQLFYGRFQINKGIKALHLNRIKTKLLDGKKIPLEFYT